MAEPDAPRAGTYNSLSSYNQHITTSPATIMPGPITLRLLMSDSVQSAL